MKNFNLGLCLTSLLILWQESVFQSVSSAPSSCVSKNGVPGRCVGFEQCPPFLRLLTGETPTPENIKLLQRLTCGFEREEPMICCPTSDIVSREKDSEFPFPIERPALEDNNHSQFGPSTPVTIEPTTRSTVTTEKEPDWSEFIPEEDEEFVANDRFQGKVPNFRGHVNFKLLPTLKDCSNPIASDRIVGGVAASLASYPWMARIGYRSEETGEIEFYCGGTVINKRYILTAAHCTEEIDSEELTPAIIRVGEHDTTTYEDCSPTIGCTNYTDYRIQKLIPHERYNPDDKSNDIELIRVDREINFDYFDVRPVCLPFPVEYGLANVWRNSFSPSKNKAFVTGWGRTKWNKAEGSAILQEVQLPIVSNAQCLSNYMGRIKITSRQMCAGGIKEKDSCGGDSGGPLQFPVIVSGEGKFFQLGVVSFGPVQCGVGIFPGVYTRVSAYRDWILDNIKP